MKQIILIVVFIEMSMFAMAQLYVNNNGYIGIGTSNPQASLQITRLNNNFTFKPSNSGSLEIGGYNGLTNATITFWHSNSGFNALTAFSYYKSSDSTLKTDIQPIHNAIETLTNINGYSYLYKDNPNSEGLREYGVIAQEIGYVLPELIDTAKGFLVVDYDQLIPFLIEAIKEQQKEISELRQILEDLEIGIVNNGSKNCQDFDFGTDDDFLSVVQNVPNPYSNVTKIKCHVPKNIRNAQLCIYNINGVLVRCFDITERGDVELQIIAGSLSAGVYAYMLVGDGHFSETKQMILTK